MSAVGRNDPCPCGSGRKYKQCCLRAVDVADLTWRRMREAEGRLIPRMWHLAVEAWGQDGVDEAYSVFFAGTPVPDDPLAHPEHESLFLTWFALRFAPAAGKTRDRRPGALRLLEAADDLSELDRRVVEAASRRAPSFHVVAAVVPGRSIDLEDILTGAPCTVVERAASATVRRGGVIYARVVTIDGVSIMIGCGAAQLPPIRRSDVADLRDRLAGRDRRLTDQDVFAFDDVLRRWYLVAADQERHPLPPKLTNTDGDPIAPTMLHFAIRCPPDEAFEALRSLSVTEDDEEALLGDGERDEQGRLRGFSLDWTKAGNRLHRSWDNTILGHLEVHGDVLTASVNSNRRATRLRRQIDKRLGARVMFVRTVIESVGAMMAEATRRRADPPPEDFPELTAEFERRHWDTWVDLPLPALKNRTPREAAGTAEGRERLDALLAEFEWRGGVPVHRLRAALKLASR